ncbi:WD40 repeat domain-containing protein [Paraburkholderia sp. CNPSo 3155]|uniref:WD40 repeat domain-containing protein n=1 Tax=Paraburkholderia atlantica TaxID=2654982 RepID=UPI00128D8959|nr:WD40 repeat domain-containing protein [Paraburkholderia atlantica]MPW05347.1 WD40 repeat domain-containing protein [Paraburkholderia atlantica]
MNAPHVLIDLLGARWETDASVVEVVWDDSGQCAGFALGDGTLALATGVWEGGPRLKPRESGGGVEFVQAQAPPAPLARFSVHEGTCLALAADPAGGFLSGGDDGRLVHLRLDGTSALVAHEVGAWIDRVAASPVGGRSYACGRRVHWLGPKPACLMLSGSATSMAFDPSGTQLAISHHGGVTVWAADTLRERELAWRGFHRNVAWSPDGRYLVSGMEENALHGWRLADGADIEMGGYLGQPRSLSFSADGRFLATSGGMRAVCWRFDPPGADAGPHESGIAGKTPVSVVVCHPIHPLIAVGYYSGVVLLCQPGSSDMLFVKGSGNSAVSALAWSPDGRRLALGTEAGELALVFLPDELFRFGRRR